MKVTVTEVGPLFDGRLNAAIGAGLDEGLRDTAQAGVDLIRRNMRGSFREPTGAAERAVAVSDRALPDLVITDAVIYGAWLEGTSSLNEATRFPGYASFRRATQQLDGQAGHIVDQAIGERLAGL